LTWILVKNKEKTSETHLHGQTKKEKKKNSKHKFPITQLHKKNTMKTYIAQKTKPTKTNK
jgi:hypothetical protein